MGTMHDAMVNSGREALDRGDWAEAEAAFEAALASGPAGMAYEVWPWRCSGRRASRTPSARWSGPMLSTVSRSTRAEPRGLPSGSPASTCGWEPITRLPAVGPGRREAEGLLAAMRAIWDGPGHELSANQQVCIAEATERREY